MVRPKSRNLAAPSVRAPGSIPLAKRSRGDTRGPPRAHFFWGCPGIGAFCGLSYCMQSRYITYGERKINTKQPYIKTLSSFDSALILLWPPPVSSSATLELI